MAKHKMVIVTQEQNGNKGSIRINANKTLEQVRKQLARIGRQADKNFENISNGDFKKQEQSWENRKHLGDYGYGEDSKTSATSFDKYRGRGNKKISDGWTYTPDERNGLRTMGDIAESGDFNRFMKEAHPYEGLSMKANVGG